MQHGTPWVEPEAVMSDKGERERFNTMHMWFIYLLFWFCVLSAAAAPLIRLLPTRIKAGAQHWLITSPRDGGALLS